MQLAKTQKSQEKIDTGSGWWRCWGTGSRHKWLDLHMYEYMCLSVYKVQPHNSRARLRPKLRKSSQHCHFSACFSFFYFFFLWKFIKKQLWLCWGPSPRANLTRSQAQQQHKQQQDPRDETVEKEGGVEGATPIATVGSVSQSVSQTEYAYQLPFSPPLVIHPFINTQRRQLLFLLRDFLVYLWIAVNLIPPIRWLCATTIATIKGTTKG